MSAVALEAFLATILVDPHARVRFRADPRAETARAGLTVDECSQVMAIDWSNLILAAATCERKRRRKTTGSIGITRS